MRLALVAITILALLHLYGCGAKASAFNTANCSAPVAAGGSHFRECQLFGRTCIIGAWGPAGSDNPGTIWCAQ